MARRRPQLDRELIVAAALETVEEAGLDDLTMRGLAARLDAAPMSLYRHVADKDELVGLVVEALVAGLPPIEPVGPWDEILVAAFARMRGLLRAYPGLAAHLSSQAVITPSSLRLAESALEALRRAGHDDASAAEGFLALWTFTVGSVLVEQTLAQPFQGSADATRERMAKAIEGAATGALPRIAAAAPHWLRTGDDHVFETGLALLIDALRTRAVTPDAPPSG